MRARRAPSINRKASRASATSSAKCTISAAPPPRPRNRRATPATLIRHRHTPAAHDEDDSAWRCNDYGSEGDADDLSAEPYGGWQSAQPATVARTRGRERCMPARPRGRRTNMSRRGRALLSRADPDYRGADHSRRAGDGIVAVAAHHRPVSFAQPDRRTAAGAQHEADLAAEILRPRAAEKAPARRRRGQAASQAVPAVAQRVVLYEEDPNNPQGKRYVGSVIWRTETVSPGPGLAPELAVRADVEIPERQITMTWSLRRNTDPALPASHTIEIQFTLPPDFAGGGIANVPGHPDEAIGAGARHAAWRAWRSR